MHSICNLKYFTIHFKNFIKCFIKKYITFTVPIQKIDKNGEEITKNISHILQFIDSTRFMASSLSSLVIISLKEFTELNVNLDTMIKNEKLVKLNITYNVNMIFSNIQTLKII